MRWPTCILAFALSVSASPAIAQEREPHLAVLCGFYEVTNNDPAPTTLNPTGPKRLWLMVLSGAAREKFTVFDPTSLFDGATLKSYNFSETLGKFAIVFEQGDRIVGFQTDAIDLEEPHIAHIGTGRYTDDGELFEERYSHTGKCMFFNTDDPTEVRREIAVLAESEQ